MVRPRKCRMVDAPPEVTYFKPRGVPLSDLSEVSLSLEGFEALRLADYEGLKHELAAGRMKVSRQTFGRILAEAREIVAKSLVMGSALRIQGGDYALAGDFKSAPSGVPRAGYATASGSVEAGSVRPIEEKPGDIKESDMEKIAITSEGPTLEDALDPRFGRAAGFVVDPQTLEFEYVDNGASQAMAQGAGIQAAENIARAGAKALLTGYVGPKAFAALQAAGIKVGQDLENLTVRQAIEKFTSGQVQWADNPNRMGHGR